jgi:hypothetical protein
MTPPSEQPFPSVPQAAAPGWYPDPAATGSLRWWDGIRWGPEAPPAVPAAAAPPGTGPSWWAWAVALSPLLWLAVAALTAFQLGPSANLSGPGPVLAGSVTAGAFAVFAAWRDTVALRASGECSKGAYAWWCLVAGWAYMTGRLIRLRSRRGTDKTLVAVAAAAWIAAVISVGAVAASAQSAGTVLNRPKLQQDIASWIRSRTGEAATVNCPADPAMSQGSQFDCVATAQDGSTAVVTVTVQDSQGDVVWKVTG